MDILWNYALTESAAFSLRQHTVSFSQECSLSSLVLRVSLLPRLWECGCLTCRSVASIYGHSPMRTAKIWKRNILYFYFLKAFFFIRSGWLMNFLCHNYWCLCVGLKGRCLVLCLYQCHCLTLFSLTLHLTDNTRDQSIKQLTTTAFAFLFICWKCIVEIPKK